jgi:hypothetical protein
MPLAVPHVELGRPRRILVAPFCAERQAEAVIWTKSVSHDLVGSVVLSKGNRCQNRLVRYLNSPNQASMSDRYPHVSRSYSYSRILSLP